MVPVVIVKLAWAGLKNRGDYKRWPERFGFVQLPPASGPRIWIHAVSVGEVQAAVPLVRRLKQDFPCYELLITTVTPTGSIMVKQRLGTEMLHTFLPYDLPGAVKRYLDRVRPELLIVMETEIWPNLFQQCAARKIKIILANARLSQRSCTGYKRFGAFISRVVRNIDFIAAQSEVDAGRLLNLGADRDRVSVMGNMKFDVEIPDSVIARGRDLRKIIGMDRPVWIAASTHEGEEEAVLAEHHRIISKIPECLLILAPRHPERCTAVAGLCQRAGLQVIRKSQTPLVQSDSFGNNINVLLLDTIGELPVFYAAADVAFVGGSLLPGMGGHNVLEPASLGVPVITGIYTNTFAEIILSLREQSAILQISQPAQISENVFRLLSDQILRKQIGKQAKLWIQNNQGSVERLMESIGYILRSLRRPPVICQ